MLSNKQCELARVMTNDTTSDIQINKEFEALSLANKSSAALAVDALLQKHNLPFDKGFKMLINDFSHVASEFLISPATLFCVYMEYKNKK